jgi:hypothetical protein
MDMLTVLTILGMGLATYLTRIGGDLLMRNRTLGPRMTAALNAVPPAAPADDRGGSGKPCGAARHALARRRPGTET